MVLALRAMAHLQTVGVRAPTSSGQTGVAARPLRRPPALYPGEVLPPDRAVPRPQGTPAWPYPAVPASLQVGRGLSNPPADLPAGPGSRLIGLGPSYRLVAFGSWTSIRSSLDPAPCGWAYTRLAAPGRRVPGRRVPGRRVPGRRVPGRRVAAIRDCPWPSSSCRPRASLRAAELAVSPGEDAGAVPVGAVAAGAGAGS